MARNSELLAREQKNNSIPMDSTDFKDVLLDSYTQVEKDLLFRALIIKANDIYNYDTGLSNHDSEVSYYEEPLKDSEISGVSEISSGSHG